MATNDVYELTVRSLLQGQQVVNRVHLQANSGFTPTQAQAQTLADDFKEAFRGFQASQLTYVNWSLRQVWGTGVTYNTSKPIRTGGRVYEGPHSGTLTGATTGSRPAANQLAVIIKLATGLAGRRYRGRFYVAAFPYDWVDTDGTLVSGAAAAVNTPFSAWHAKYVSGGTDANWDYGIWSFRHASGWKPAPAHPHNLIYVGPISSQNEITLVSAWSLSDLFGTQRRRRIGVGV